MIDDFFRLYEGELFAIRELAQGFAKKYPAAARRLLFKENEKQSTDPHVERLIESFAYLTARVQHKLEDEFPELTDALFSVLYPHYLAPIPSMAVVQFDIKPAAAPIPEGFLIPEHEILKAPPINDLQCQYRTGWPVMLWPVKLTMARLQPPPFPTEYQPPRTPSVPKAMLRLQFECLGNLKFEELALERLRFYLCGSNQTMPELYELIFNNVMSVAFRPLDRGDRPDAPLEFAPLQVIHPVGFEPHEGLLPYPPQSFLGYRLLTEFFAFPNKFWFFDLSGWQRVARRGDFGRRLEVDFYLDRSIKQLEQEVNEGTFRIGCTPVVNLFEYSSEPIPLTPTKAAHLLIPDVHHPLGLEVYSITEVVSVNPGATRAYYPFYSFRHEVGAEGPQTFWHASRRPSQVENDRGTELYLHFVDLQFNPKEPPEEVLLARMLCTNRDLPTKLLQLGDNLRFDLLMAAPPVDQILCARTPTPPLRPPLRQGLYWRLLSHLSLNHLSLTEDASGREAFQEMLRLYDFSDAESGQQLANITRQIIDGILDISHRRIIGRMGSGFCRGLEITLTFDDQKYVGTGVYLFAAVLERFIALYANINSFTQMVARTRQREGVMKKWPARAGVHPLL